MKHRVFLCCLAAMMIGLLGQLVAEDRIKTATPIKHLVVIFQENVSFDHYFGVYPNALNDDRRDSVRRRRRRLQRASTICSRRSM